MEWIIAILTPILLIIFLVIISGIRIINQYERGVILTLGRYSGTRHPGFNIIIPVVQQLIKVDMRLATVDIPGQEVITRDNVTIGIDAVVYFRVKNAEQAVLEVQNFRLATVQYAQAAMRDVVGGVNMDTLLSERERVTEDIKNIVDIETEQWGIDIESIKVQNVELPQDMKRAMAKQAEAERERRAVIINAEGEYAAAQKIAEAAHVLSSVSGAMQIRTLETLEKISVEKSQKTLFVLPTDLYDQTTRIASLDASD